MHILLSKTIRGKTTFFCECGAWSLAAIPCSFIPQFLNDIADIHREHVRSALASGAILMDIPALEPFAQPAERDSPSERDLKDAKDPNDF